jgi:hypothetical protein
VGIQTSDGRELRIGQGFYRIGDQRTGGFIDPATAQYYGIDRKEVDERLKAKPVRVGYKDVDDLRILPYGY